MQMKNRRAVVTGGGRGIGRAVALALAREGADVCVTARSEEEINGVAEQIRGLGRKAVVIVCDVAAPESVDAMMSQAVEALGGLDVLVNNAGGAFQRSAVRESDAAEWKRTIDVNLLGAYYCARAAIEPMIASGGGKIINVGSGMGHQARAGNSAYNAAKAGLWMFTRCLALELWDKNIEVNELVPGPVYTDLTAGYFDPSLKVPPPFAESERVKTPEECVPLALFLASHPPGGPTGQTFSLARRPV